MSSINQKDVLIKSLKFTIENLTNIIVNSNKNINDINDNINETIKSELDEIFLKMSYKIAADVVVLPSFIVLIFQ